MKDEILIKAKQLSKISKDDAIQFLANEASKFTVNNDLFFKYFFKSLDYVFSGYIYDYSKTIESNFIQLFEVLDSNKLFNSNYQKACDYLFRFYIRIGDGNKAKQTANRLTYLLLSNPSNYLLISKELNQKSMLATQYFNISQKSKDVQFLYFFIASEMFDVAWHLSVDINRNMLNYEINQFGHSKFDFKTFEIFNNMNWSANPNDLIDEFGFNSVILKRYFDKLSEFEILQRIENTLFRLLPTRIGLKPEFLDLEYNDIDTFGKWFESLNYDKDSFQSFVAIEIDEIANIFTNK